MWSCVTKLCKAEDTRQGQKESKRSRSSAVLDLCHAVPTSRSEKFDKGLCFSVLLRLSCEPEGTPTAPNETGIGGLTARYHTLHCARAPLTELRDLGTPFGCELYVGQRP